MASNEEKVLGHGAGGRDSRCDGLPHGQHTYDLDRRSSSLVGDREVHDLVDARGQDREVEDSEFASGQRWLEESTGRLGCNRFVFRDPEARRCPQEPFKAWKTR